MKRGCVAVADLGNLFRPQDHGSPARGNVAEIRASAGGGLGEQTARESRRALPRINKSGPFTELHRHSDGELTTINHPPVAVYK